MILAMIIAVIMVLMIIMIITTIDSDDENDEDTNAQGRQVCSRGVVLQGPGRPGTN